MLPASNLLHVPSISPFRAKSHRRLSGDGCRFFTAQKLGTLRKQAASQPVNISLSCVLCCSMEWKKDVLRRMTKEVLIFQEANVILSVPIVEIVSSFYCYSLEEGGWCGNSHKSIIIFLLLQVQYTSPQQKDIQISREKRHKRTRRNTTWLYDQRKLAILSS